MATLEEVLTEIRDKQGYVNDRLRATDHSGIVKMYTFWFARDSDYPTEIRDYEIRILVMNEGKPEEDARVYSTRNIEQIPHAFRDALLTKISDFLTANPDYEKVMINNLSEVNEYATGIAVHTSGSPTITTIINWAGFIKEGETTVTLRILS